MLYEVITYVNDGSRDETLPILKAIAEKNKNVRIISFSRNFGHQAAVTAGVQNSEGDCVVIIDADLQDPPELIPDMIKLWQEGNDVVYAKRKKRKGVITSYSIHYTKLYDLALSFSWALLQLLILISFLPVSIQVIYSLL